MKPSAAYRNYVLFMLIMVYLFSLIDRQILAVLIEPIKKEFALSDTQLGLLSGLAFGLLYATMAVPLSRLGDRWSRRSLIAICLAGWSIATGLCGAAQGFLSLFAARVAVGTGEAGAGPASQSLISDYFPPERRATALGIYSMGIFIGAGLGLALGGWLASLYGWRGAFMAVAIPGVVLALIFRLTVREPVRGHLDPVRSSAVVPPFAESVRIFMRNKALVSAAFGIGFSVYVVQSLLNWLPAFMSRYHGMQPMEAGGKIGPIIAVMGTIGVVTGGLLADRLSRRDPRNSPRMMALSVLLVLPAAITGLLAESQALMFGAFAVTFFLTALLPGPTFGLVQNLAQPSLRSFSAAMLGLFAVILGNAFGPFLTGVGSDVLAGLGVDESLRWSLILSVSLSGLGSIFYLRAAKHLPERSAAPAPAGGDADAAPTAV
jgi:MFS family permease